MKHSFLFFAALLTTPFGIYAGELIVDGRFSSSHNAYQVTVAVDTRGEPINAVECHTSFDNRKLRFKSSDTNGSLVSLWVKKPSLARYTGLFTAELEFSGIIPGGFSGTYSAFATTSFILPVTTLFFEVNSSGPAQLVFSKCLLFKNDGTGDSVVIKDYVHQATLPKLGIRSGQQDNSVSSESLLPVTLLNASWRVDANGKPRVDFLIDPVVKHYKTVYVSESINGEDIPLDSYKWNLIETTSYSPFYSSSRFVHFKVLWSDGTYSQLKLPTPEGDTHSQAKMSFRGILLVAFLLCVAFFLKHILRRQKEL